MKVMVSACLLGDNVKYNGKNNKNDALLAFLKDKDVIKVCPECLGDLKVPRSPSEIQGNRVINKEGRDVTSNYLKGAEKTLKIAQNENIKVAILKKNSPSCGSQKIYDGTFSNNLIEGEGITAKLLKKNGIVVLDEDNYLEYKW